MESIRLPRMNLTTRWPQETKATSVYLQRDGLLGDPVVKTPRAGVWGSIPDQGAGSHMPQLGVHMPQLKVLRAARKMEDLVCHN